ncbi:tRNA preQ1(34) S-adenosylmethionine ribosyltransferase-isomerase QueA [Limoniibacter endophyticus]|uniref:S-adenosylmethionine:tRNA ribosyltransferase-isomerase n=1 Tax=Limoniibacter endophyticus TaxID=1565040 RepID=A0A8J3GGN4_9HYPH|nr:tRNA preQ1(34) S-adenosylmethionine ribosyltransferase-isomerase QueA [Limoniibacter endophyticus]GHC61214.1 S-adenosylmethionine:tRNA ribosyltransferase-isomerase [Limoniibacter endophyticus]
MRVDLFDFTLPDELIALRPAEPRESAKLLVVEGDRPLVDKTVADLPDLLRPDDLLVFNDTRVIPAHLSGIRERDGNVVAIEGTLHLREAPDRWRAFMKPGKRLKAGDRIRFGRTLDSACTLGTLDATVVEKSENGDVLLAFDLSGPYLDDALREIGHVPLPPYIASRRGDDDQDKRDYQTVFARDEGAVAAPTAGLHFTPELIARLEEIGLEHCFVTLHVGAGTFQPVKADDTENHRMHAEIGIISVETAERINAAKQAGRRIVAVGTTSLRLLESATDEHGEIHAYADKTDIFITPGYRFRAVDVLMTNFHLPKSTLFMLVSAFCGLEKMKQAYVHAIAQGYRFYSYGDASLLTRDDR